MRPSEEEVSAWMKAAVQPDEAEVLHVLATLTALPPRRASWRLLRMFEVMAAVAAVTLLVTIAVMAFRSPEGSGAAGGPSSPGYAVTILPGLDLRLTPQAVAATVQGLLLANASAAPDVTTPIQIVSVEATTMDRAIEETNGLRSSVPNTSAVWLIRARGPFVAHFGPPEQKPAPHSEGFYVIDDATGQVWSMGFQPIPSSGT